MFPPPSSSPARLHSVMLVLVFAVALAACSAAVSKPAPSSSAALDTNAAAERSADGPPLAPLTGLPAADIDVERRAVAVKIDNHPEAQPQTGLNAADLVIEEVVEAGLTRFMAVYHSTDAPHVGPVRSGRPVDVDILRTLGDPALVISGAQDEVIAMLGDSQVDYVSDDDGHPAYARDNSNGHQPPHDLFTSLPAARDLIKTQIGAPREPARFSNSPMPDAKPAPNVIAAFSDKALVRWMYDGDRAVYVRHLDGAPQRLADGSEVVADNLVFQFVPEVFTGLTDSVGSEVPDWEITGSGKVMVARGGEIASGEWRRSKAGRDIALETESGDVIALAPGRTWWSLVPTTGAVNTS